MLPFVLLFLAVLHVFFLHGTGSGNPLGARRGTTKVRFYPFRAYTDLERLLGLVFMVTVIVFLGGLVFVDDPDNFILANSLAAPAHIQPEWYFLFAYAILRAIPNKLGGVVALVASVIVIYTLPLRTQVSRSRRIINRFKKTIFWVFVIVVVLLT